MTNPSNKQCKITPTSYTCMHVCCNVCQIHRTILRATVILLPLLGLTWLFGLLTLNKNATVFAWLFTIFNSLQVTTHTLAHQSCHENSHVLVTMPANLCNVLSGFYLYWGWQGEAKHFAFTPNILAPLKVDVSFLSIQCLNQPVHTLLRVMQLPLQIENHPTCIQ